MSLQSSWHSFLIWKITAKKHKTKLYIKAFLKSDRRQTLVLLDPPHMQLIINWLIKKVSIKPIWNQLNGVTNKIVPICTALLNIKVLIKLGQFSEYSIFREKSVLETDQIYWLPGLAKSQHCRRCILGNDLRNHLYLKRRWSASAGVPIPWVNKSKTWRQFYRKWKKSVKLWSFCSPKFDVRFPDMQFTFTTSWLR